ncbi:Timeless family protein [Citrus sinensis]|uniref:Timeless family protein n=1 Tax=Citrus sinensis TaxID=2711 RepID=A0ACB8HRL6_CITSI|nr:Timeless family protein [Citrus sinensis]
METEGLSVICAGLGIIEEDEKGNRIGYSKGEQCSENLKDLLRFLRRDDPQKREVFKQVCKWSIVSKDLIPIIEHCQDDRNLVLNSVKVLVFLTMPIESSSNDIPQQIEYLWGLKSAITCSDTVAVIVSLLEGPLENLEREAFTEDDWKLVQLVLTLFRNILAVQDIPLQQKAGGSAIQYVSLRDRFLELLFNENVMDIIIVITQHVCGSCGYFRQDNLLLLEIFHYIFMGQDPELIAKAHQRGSKTDGDTKDPLDSLKSIIAEEQEKRRLSRLHNLVLFRNLVTLVFSFEKDGSKAVFKGNPASASHNPIIKPHKGQKGMSKKIMWDQGSLPSTKDNVLELLYDFLNQFLSGSYNVLMQSIQEDIEKEAPAIQSSDIISFFRVAQFLVSFQYHKIAFSKPALEKEALEASTTEFADSTLFKGNICGPIASTMDESMFKLVISKWQDASEDLKKTNNYKFMSAAASHICLYFNGLDMRVKIRMLDLVLKSLPEDSKESQTARILLYKLFYDQTDQGLTQFLLNLIKMLDTHKQPKSDLADLVEMIYVLVRLTENLQARGALRVSRKSRKGRKKGTVKGNKETENELSGNHATIHNENCISNSGDLANSCIPQKEIVTDATSDGKEDTGIPFKVDDHEIAVQERGNLGGSQLQMDSRKSDHAENDHYCSTGDSSGDEQPTATNEVDFKVSTFLSAFANSSIIKKLCWLLKFYKSNSNRTNHYIIRMLRRITDDLELSPMLYQLSLLTVFYDILAEQKSCPSKEYENIVDFLTRLAKGWARRSIADALGEDEADVVISHEFGYPKMTSMKEESEKVSKRKRRLVLDEEWDMKIKDLYEKFKDDRNCSRCIAESLDPDGKVSAAQVSNKLKQLGVKVAPKRRGPYSGETSTAGPDQHEEDQCVMETKTSLHNSNNLDGSSLRHPQFKHHKRCSYMIANALDAGNKFTSAQVSRKLKQLDLRAGPLKKSKTDMHLRDEEPNDSAIDKLHDSDQETLLSFRKRNKHSGRLFHEESQVKNLKRRLSDGSDDETLSSVLKKSRKHLAEAEDDRLQTETVWNEESNDNTAVFITKHTMERDGCDQSSVIDVARTGEVISASHISLEGTSEAELIDSKTLGVSHFNNEDDMEHQLMDDDFADSGGDAAAGGLMRSSVSRRKLRMVIDPEDDD